MPNGLILRHNVSRALYCGRTAKGHSTVSWDTFDAQATPASWGICCDALVRYTRAESDSRVKCTAQNAPVNSEVNAQASRMQKSKRKGHM